MNMRPENRCGGSGQNGHWADTAYAGTFTPLLKSWCSVCRRHGIRVRVTGELFAHSKVGPRHSGKIDG
jgi:hypothetical protein